MVEKNETYKKLLAIAKESLKYSYAPYSNYKVGAALLTKEGAIYSGCNVEVATLDGGVCAERAAVVKAVSEGHRQFEAVAVVGEKTLDIWPCGICRQYLREFGNNLVIISHTAEGDVITKSLQELFPFSFGPDHVLGV